MLSFGRYVRISKEHHNIASRLPLQVHIAEKADRVMNSRSGGDIDVGKELDSVLFRTGVRRRKGCAEQGKGEDAANHCELPYPKEYAQCPPKVPNRWKNRGRISLF